MDEDGGAVIGATPQERAYAGPFLAFIGLFGLGSLIQHLFDGQAWWVISTPEYWLYPLQAAVTGALLWHWRAHYEFSRPVRISWTIAIGVLVLVLWISPQAWLGFTRRTVGFDPGHFGIGGAYAVNVTLRIVRAVVVVPFAEEIFWRGFLLRFVIDQDFTKVGIGKLTVPAFLVVTAGFTLEHQMVDWPAAALTGALYNLVAFRTGSLSSCVLAHAVTNAGLCAYVLATGQWGFW